ncbi:MAG TPA: cation:proton antiporter regulatory subunit [Acidimicrobiia bacterium]|jgi:TrkA domain protein
MSEIAETQLPGVGVRYDFTTEDGRRVGVIHRHGGRREMFVCPAGDPDTTALTMELTDDDAHTLVEVLGVSRVIEALHQLQQMEGLALDWLRVSDGSPYAGRTIGDARIRTRTGASVVAAIRGGAPHPAPGPEFRLEAGDTVVVVGTAGGIEAVRSIIASG